MRHDFSETLSVCSIHPKTQTDKLVFGLVISGGEIDHSPPGFFGFHRGNCFKIGKMHDALTAMVFNRLL